MQEKSKRKIQRKESTKLDRTDGQFLIVSQSFEVLIYLPLYPRDIFDEKYICEIFVGGLARGSFFVKYIFVELKNYIFRSFLTLADRL